MGLCRGYFGQNQPQGFLADRFDEVMRKSRFLGALSVGLLSPTRYRNQSRFCGGQLNARGVRRALTLIVTLSANPCHT